VDVGLSTVTRMAREDTRWFVIGVVVLSLVLFLVLPIGVLIAVDNEKRLGRAEARIDRKIKRLEKLEESLKEKDEKAAVPRPAAGTDNGL
jgi:prefoldin subunit 5